MRDMSRPVQEYLGDVFDDIRGAVEEPRMQSRLSACIFWIFPGTLKYTMQGDISSHKRNARVHDVGDGAAYEGP